MGGGQFQKVTNTMYRKFTTCTPNESSDEHLSVCPNRAKMLEQAELMYPGCEIVYGDTDSITIRVKKEQSPEELLGVIGQIIPADLSDETSSELTEDSSVDLSEESSVEVDEIQQLTDTITRMTLLKEFKRMTLLKEITSKRRGGRSEHARKDLSNTRISITKRLRMIRIEYKQLLNDDEIEIADDSSSNGKSVKQLSAFIDHMRELLHQKISEVDSKDEPSEEVETLEQLTYTVKRLFLLKQFKRTTLMGEKFSKKKMTRCDIVHNSFITKKLNMIRIEYKQLLNDDEIEIADDSFSNGKSVKQLSAILDHMRELLQQKRSEVDSFFESKREQSSEEVVTVDSETILNYGKKWNGRQFQFILQEDPTYCVGIILKKWSEGEGSKLFRNWLITKERLQILYKEYPTQMITSGKMKNRRFADVSKNEPYFCSVVRNKPVEDNSLRQLCDFLKIGDLLEVIELCSSE